MGAGNIAQETQAEWSHLSALRKSCFLHHGREHYSNYRCCGNKYDHSHSSYEA